MMNSKTHHVTALVAGLGGEPEKYHFHGDVIDNGMYNYTPCACGCAIRWQFIVVHEVTQKRKSLGSTCITHYAEYRAEDAKRMLNKLDELERARREAERKALLAQAETEATAARNLFEKAHEKMRMLYESYQSKGEKAPRNLWEICASWHWAIPKKCSKRYVRPKSYTTWYEKNTAQIESVLSGCGFDEQKIVAERAKSAAEQRQQIECNSWLVKVLEDADNGRSPFIRDMLTALKRGDSFNTDFSRSQKAVMGNIFAKSFGSNGSQKNERAHEYFDLMVKATLVDMTAEEYVNQKQVVKPVNASEGLDTNGLPF